MISKINPCVLGPFVVLILAAPAFTHPHEAILFESYQNNNWEICQIHADGTNLVNLTRTKDIHELYPQASPAGDKIAFLVDEHEGRKITRSAWIMNADGTDRKKITDGARHISWSPDGSRLAFAKQEFSRFSVKDYVTKYLYFYDVKSETISKHPNEKIEHIYVPSWSADQNWIITTVHGGMGYGHAIVAIEIDGDRVVDLKIPGCRPCVSRDGKMLTWSSDDHTIEIGDLDFSSETPTLSNRRVHYKHAKMHLYHPDFSPDGKIVTFSYGPGGRVAANGPGTQTEVAEMTGVRGEWDIYAKTIGSDEEPRRVTKSSESSNKESEWIVIAE